MCHLTAVARNFEGVTGRDDIVLQQSANELTLALAGDIYEPGIDGGLEDFNRLGSEARREASMRASRLASAVNTARNLSFSQRHDAITTLQAHFGRRIPSRPDWIETDASGDDIRRVRASKVAAPVVGSSKAG